MPPRKTAPSAKAAAGKSAGKVKGSKAPVSTTKAGGTQKAKVEAHSEARRKQILKEAEASRRHVQKLKSTFIGENGAGTAKTGTEYERRANVLADLVQKKAPSKDVASARAAMYRAGVAFKGFSTLSPAKSSQLPKLVEAHDKLNRRLKSLVSQRGGVEANIKSGKEELASMGMFTNGSHREAVKHGVELDSKLLEQIESKIAEARTEIKASRKEITRVRSYEIRAVARERKGDTAGAAQFRDQARKTGEAAAKSLEGKGRIDGVDYQAGMNANRANFNRAEAETTSAMEKAKLTRDVGVVAFAATATVASGGAAAPTLGAALTGIGAGTTLGAVTNVTTATIEVGTDQKSGKQAMRDAGVQTMHDAKNSAIAAASVMSGGAAGRVVLGANAGSAGLGLRTAAGLAAGAANGATNSALNTSYDAAADAATGKQTDWSAQGKRFVVNTATSAAGGAAGAALNPAATGAATTAGAALKQRVGELGAYTAIGGAATYAQTGQLTLEDVAMNTTNALGSVALGAAMNRGVTPAAAGPGPKPVGSLPPSSSSGPRNAAPSAGSNPSPSANNAKAPPSANNAKPPPGGSNSTPPNANNAKPPPSGSHGTPPPNAKPPPNASGTRNNGTPPPSSNAKASGPGNNGTPPPPNGNAQGAGNNAKAPPSSSNGAKASDTPDAASAPRRGFGKADLEAPVPSDSDIDTNPYAVFGLPKGAAFADLKKAYRAIRRESHPDINQDKLPQAEAWSKVYSRAWDALEDHSKRAFFHRYGQVAPSKQHANEWAQRMYMRDNNGREPTPDELNAWAKAYAP